MISVVLTGYAEKLEDFLGGMFHQPEGIVKVGDVGDEHKEECTNKLVITLLSLERETSQGIAVANVRNGSGGFNTFLPPVNMNMDVMFAAVYEGKRYPDALEILSATILFLQANPVLMLAGKRYTIEIVNISSQELNNIWTCMGGHYYPSVVCKIRKVLFDAKEVKGTSGQTGKPSIDTEKKN